MKNIINTSIRVLTIILIPLLLSCATTQQKASIYDWRGITYVNKGQYDQAISEFNKAIEIDPRYDGAHYNRGRFHYLKKEYDKSWKDIKRAQDLGYKIPTEFLDDLRNASGREN